MSASNESKGPVYSRDNPRPCSFNGTPGTYKGSPTTYDCRCCPENCNGGEGYCCSDCRYQPRMAEIRAEEDAAWMTAR